MPIILCNEMGVLTLICRFEKLESGSVSLKDGGELTAVEVVVRMSGSREVPAIITINLVGKIFPMQLSSPDRNSSS